MSGLTELFIEAGTLMIAGMVFVFVFLGLLVVFINQVLAKLAIAYPDPVVEAKPIRKKSPKASTGISPSIVAAISSAVSSYRQQHNQNK